MLWKREAIPAQPQAGSGVRCALLLAAMRAFREAELEAAGNPSREGLALAEFAEIVLLPNSSVR